MKATCYSFRRENGQKVVGGALGMSRDIDMNEAADQVQRMLDINITPAGSVQYMYNGSPVYAYLSIDPAETDEGKAALREWRAARKAEQDSYVECECCGSRLYE